MLQEDFEQLRKHILDKNNYFHNGYANAYKDDTTSAVFIENGKDRQRVLPADSLGNYFYLRNDKWTNHEAKYSERLSDTGTQRLSFLDTISIRLVAIVKSADEYQLIENLRNTVLMYKSLDVQPVTSSWNREQIVTAELTKMNVNDVNASLQRLTDETIIRVGLSVSKVYIPSNCITNPIKPETDE